MTYDQWKTRDPNDKGFYDMPEDDGPTELDLVYDDLARAKTEIERLRLDYVELEKEAQRDYQALEAECGRLQKALEKVRLIAEDVVWFDWSNNDPDAVHAIEQLRLALGDVGQPGHE